MFLEIRSTEMGKKLNQQTNLDYCITNYLFI
jgi:hypothetical protein